MVHTHVVPDKRIFSTLSKYKILTPDFCDHHLSSVWFYFIFFRHFHPMKELILKNMQIFKIKMVSCSIEDLNHHWSQIKFILTPLKSSQTELGNMALDMTSTSSRTTQGPPGQVHCVHRRSDPDWPYASKCGIFPSAIQMSYWLASSI